MRQLFINTILNMVDNQSIFSASREYWGNVFDGLEAGNVENVDSTCLTVYKTIKAVGVVQNNPQYTRLDEKTATRRMLLASIEARLKGLSVWIVCRDNIAVKELERDFSNMVDQVTPLLYSRHGSENILKRGEIRFLSMSSRSNSDQFSWGQRSIQGAGFTDVVYIAPELLNYHYAPMFAEYKQNSSEIILSDFMQNIENAVMESGKNTSKNIQAFVERSMQWSPANA